MAKEHKCGENWQNRPSMAQYEFTQLPIFKVPPTMRMALSATLGRNYVDIYYKNLKDTPWDLAIVWYIPPIDRYIWHGHWCFATSASTRYPLPDLHPPSLTTPKHAKPFKVSLDFEQTFLSDKVSSSFATVFFLASFAPFEEAAIEVSFTGPSRGGQNQPNGGLLTGLSWDGFFDGLFHYLTSMLLS